MRMYDAFLDAYIAELEDDEKSEEDMNPDDFSRSEVIEE